MAKSRSSIKDALSKLPLVNSDGKLLVKCDSCQGGGGSNYGVCTPCKGAGLIATNVPAPKEVGKQLSVGGRS